MSKVLRGVLLYCFSAISSTGVQAQSLQDEIRLLIGDRTPEQSQADGVFRTREFECRRSLESDPQTAIANCEAAVTISRQLSPQQRLERSNASSMLGQAFFVNRRYADALPRFQEAVEFASQGASGLNNDNVATLLQVIGVTHYALRDFAKATDSMDASIRSFEGAIAALPSMRTRYTEMLQGALRQYADMKRGMGDAAAADSLRKKADSLAPSPAAAPAAAAVEEFRILDGVRLMGSMGARLTADDLEKIRALAPASAPPVWMIIGKRVGMYGPLAWDIEVYLQPDFSSANLRVGRMMTLTADVPAADQFAANKTWTQRVVNGRYAQAPIAREDPQDVRSERDFDRPFSIIEFGDLAKFTNEELSSLVGFVRAEGARTPVTARPRMSTDVQPWGLQTLMRWSPTEAEAILINPRTPGNQSVRMRFGADSISILEMR